MIRTYGVDGWKYDLPADIHCFSKEYHEEYEVNVKDKYLTEFAEYISEEEFFTEMADIWDPDDYEGLDLDI